MADFELEAPGAIDAPEKSGPPDYTGPEQRCQFCKNFEDDRCQKFEAEVIGEGHCTTWEAPEEGVDSEVEEIEE